MDAGYLNCWDVVQILEITVRAVGMKVDIISSSIYCYYCICLRIQQFSHQRNNLVSNKDCPPVLTDVLWSEWRNI